jgi:hypothetical protein
MKMMNDFVVFIITHGRADNVFTDSTLRQRGYTGPIYYVVDNEDKTIEMYKKKYGDLVKVFDKKFYANLVDQGDNFNDRRTTTHARNACFDIAEELNYEWFWVLDDDYTNFQWRIDGQGNYPEQITSVGNLDDCLFAILNYFKNIDAKSIAIAQGGEYMGGRYNEMAVYGRIKRKAMNTFFCSTKRRFWFCSRLNEDVNTYLHLGFRGDLFFTIPLLSVVQKMTQTNAGGMSETYLESGTYVKSFTSVMYAPYSAKISCMGRTNRRIHHHIKWSTAVPQIVSESMKKCPPAKQD